MPWKIQERDGKYCVVKKTDDSVEKCHSTKDKAKKHMSALYASETKKDVGVMIFKDADGVYYGIGIVSNNRLDRHEHIITSEGHKAFVKSLDDGTYTEKMNAAHELMGLEPPNLETPEIWLWHFPAAIGKSIMTAYDDRGFLVTVWKQLETELSTKIHQILEQISLTLGMSHSFPASNARFDKENEGHIIEYYSREFTLLPLEKAANWLTGTVVMFKELNDMLKIPEHKLKWFTDKFGEAIVTELEENVDRLDKAADAARLPKKEIQMPDKLKEGQEAVEQEDVVEAATPEEDVDASETEEVETEEVETEEEEEEEEEVEEEQTGMTPTEFVLPKEALDEIVKGVSEPFNILTQRLDKLAESFEAVNNRLDTLEKEENERLAEKAAETPQASIGTIIAKSVIGQSEAQVDYNKDRDLYRGPDEAQEVADGATGISNIDDIIKRQQSKRRVIPGSAFNRN